MLRSGRARLVLGIGALLALSTLFRAWGDTLDDAFITFRAAHNLVRGQGLTFNPGAPPVECFSNPLFLILLLPSAFLGLSLPWTAKALGLFGLGLSLLGVHRLAQRAGLSELGMAAVLGTTLGSTALVYYASTGLETALLSGLLLVSLAHTAERGRLDAMGTLLWTMVALSRPETPLLLVLSLPFLLKRPLDRGTQVGLATIATVLLGLELGRIAYFGDVVPNTFHAKLPGTADHDPSSSGLLAGPLYVLRFALACGLILPLGAAFSLSLCRSLSPDDPRRPVLCGALPAPPSGLVFALYAGGDWMPMGRYLAPYVPLVGLAGVLGLEELLRRTGSTRGQLMLGLAVLGSYLGGLDQASELWLHAQEFPYHVMSSRDSIAAIERMPEHLSPGASVVAFRIGALGDVGGYEVIDLLGLADRRIARIAGQTPGYHPQRTRMGDDVPELRAYVASLAPDAVLLVTFAEGELDSQIELYNATWRLAEAYPIGVDQRWVLYVRAPSE